MAMLPLIYANVITYLCSVSVVLSESRYGSDFPPFMLDLIQKRRMMTHGYDKDIKQ
jgi:hypothetical protein